MSPSLPSASAAYPVAARPTASNVFYVIASGLLVNGLSRKLDPFLSETRFPGNPGGRTVPPAGSGIRYCVSPKTGGAYKGAPVAVSEVAGERFDRPTDPTFVTFVRETYSDNDSVIARLSAGIFRFLASDLAAGLSAEARDAIVLTCSEARDTIVSLYGSDPTPAPKRTRRANPAA